MNNCTKRLLAIEQLTNTLVSYVPMLTNKKTSVSAWSVGEQLHHTLLVNESILTKIMANESVEGKPTTLIGRIILFLGVIPRGKGKAPKIFVTKQLTEKEVNTLITQQLTTIAILKNIDNTTLQCSFPHPYFGLLTTKQWLRFIQIHTNHHVKIIRDIMS